MLATPIWIHLVASTPICLPKRWPSRRDRLRQTRSLLRRMVEHRRRAYTITIPNISHTRTHTHIYIYILIYYIIIYIYIIYIYRFHAHTIYLERYIHVCLCAHVHADICDYLCACFLWPAEPPWTYLLFSPGWWYLPIYKNCILILLQSSWSGWYFRNFQGTSSHFKGEFFDVSSCQHDGQVSESHSRQLEVSHGLDRALSILGWDLEGL